MKFIITILVFLASVSFTACHKATAPAHTDGLGGSRNWHVTKHYKVHRLISSDSTVYSDTTYTDADQSFALNILGGDTLLLHNDKYYFSHNTGNMYYFPIWHNQMSGNKSMITYNRDNNTIQINEILNSVSSDMETTYTSF